jgi:hypothetical protein
LLRKLLRNAARLKQRQRKKPRGRGEESYTPAKEACDMKAKTKVGKILESNAVWDINDARVKNRFRKGYPADIFLEHFKGLEKQRHIYYLRGYSRKSYQPNFIPLWIYPLICERVFMIIRIRDRNEDDFMQYCGLTFKQFAALIKRDVVIPLVEDKFDSYSDNLLKLFKMIPEDKPPYRARIYEDMILGEGNFTFSKKVENITEQKIRKIKERGGYLPEKEREYYDLKEGLFAPQNIIDLPQWVTERMLWTEMNSQISEDDKRKKLEEIERALLEHPLKAYREAHLTHYVNVHEFYARGGFVALSRGVDRLLADKGIIPGSALPSQAPYQSLLFPYPERDKLTEINRSLKMLFEAIDGKLASQRQGVLAAIAQLHSTPRFFKSMEGTFKENSQILGLAVNEFNNGLEKLVRERELRKKIVSLGRAAALTTVSLPMILSQIPQTHPLIEAELHLFIHGIFDLVKTVKDFRNFESIIKSELKEMGNRVPLIQHDAETPFIVLGCPNSQ